MEQKQVKIQGVKHLIAFLETNQQIITFDSALLIVDSFTSQPIFWSGKREVNKLVDFIKQYQDNIKKGTSIPLFIN